MDVLKINGDDDDGWFHRVGVGHEDSDPPITLHHENSRSSHSKLTHIHQDT